MEHTVEKMQPVRDAWVKRCLCLGAGGEMTVCWTKGRVQWPLAFPGVATRGHASAGRGSGPVEESFSERLL